MVTYEFFYALKEKKNRIKKENSPYEFGYINLLYMYIYL